jgi:peptidoglycan/LPS O-acetylase OafA/YrhL
MRFNNIQVLRVGAALGVVLYHLGCHGPNLIGVGWPWLSFPLLSGFPVPLFFAVSGFVLAHAVRGTPPGRFLLARFLRLMPGYWLALFGVVALMRLRVYSEHHRWMIYFVNGKSVTLWPGGPGTALYLLGVEWSLVYEAFLSVALAGLSVFGPRRAAPVLAGVWAAALVVKAVVWPNHLFAQYPHWSTIALSGFNIPFLLGVLTYQVRDRGRRWRWAVLVAVLGLLSVGSLYRMGPEHVWAVWGAAGAGAVWLAVQFRQLGDRSPVARLGDCTYGLFLFHVPLMFAVLYPASRTGWTGRVEVLWLAGAVAIVGGLLFGRLEAALHARLRPLAKARWSIDRVRLRIPWRRLLPLRRRVHDGR